MFLRNALVMAALKIAYNKKVVHSGPIYQPATIDKIKLILHFTNTVSGIITNDGEAPAEFPLPALIKSLFAPKQS